MKLIFLDIDGTLTIPGQNTPPESAIRAIRSAQKLGNKVFICTGRGMCMLDELLSYGFDGVIALAGGYVLCGDEVIYHCPMTKTQVDEILTLLHRYGVFCTLESNFECYGDARLGDFYPGKNQERLGVLAAAWPSTLCSPTGHACDPAGGYIVNGVWTPPTTSFLPATHKSGRGHHVHDVLASSFSESMAKNHPDLITKEVTHIIEKKLEFFRENMVIRPMSEWKREDIYKVVIFCERLEQLEAAREVFEQDFDFCAKHMDYLGFVNGELINRKFDKGQGILKICQTLGVPIEDTYGFGDGQNDFSMMQVVGTSVCMENGEEDLKKICDYICPSVEEDGIAKAFAKLGLCE